MSAPKEQNTKELIELRRKTIYAEVRRHDEDLYWRVVRSADGISINHDLSHKAAAAIEIALMNLAHELVVA